MADVVVLSDSEDEQHDPKTHDTTTNNKTSDNQTTDPIAISSQNQNDDVVCIDSTTPTPRTTNSTHKCAVCLCDEGSTNNDDDDDMGIVMMHTVLANCGHRVCSTCLCSHVQRSIDPQSLCPPVSSPLSAAFTTPSCPVSGCNVVLGRSTTSHVVSRGVMRGFDEWCACVMLARSLAPCCECSDPTSASAPATTTTRRGKQTEGKAKPKSPPVLVCDLGSCTDATLRSALQARNLGRFTNKQSATTSLLSHHNLTASSEVFLCPSCPLALCALCGCSLTPTTTTHTCPKDSKGAMALAKHCMKLAAILSVRLPATIASLTPLLPAPTISVTAAATSTRKRKQPQPPTQHAQQLPANKRRGVGYGGSGPSKAETVAREQAHKREVQIDAFACTEFSHVEDLLFASTQNKNKVVDLDESVDVDAVEIAQIGSEEVKFPGGVVVLLCGEVFMSSLRTLVANDSMQDVAERFELYSRLLSLLRTMSSDPDVLRALTQVIRPTRVVVAASTTTTATTTTTTPSTPTGASSASTTTTTTTTMTTATPGGGKEESWDGSDICVLDALKNLNTQAAVFLRTAPALADGEQASESVSLALAVQATVELLNNKLSATTPARKKRKPKVNTGDAETAFCTDLKEHTLFFCNLENHTYSRAVSGVSDSMTAAVRSRMLRVQKEISSLSTSLPISLHSSIFLAVDESNSDLMRALVLPSPDTPYGLSPFVFDLHLPPQYPQEPPHVLLLTTGGGRVRFNPNLYANGKVCLSLLGTWTGPSWQPADSTILQVLVSIQSLIFVDDPYFNEPGYEHSLGTPHGHSASRTYNQQQRFHTLAFALLPALQHPPPPFQTILNKYFRHQFENILALLDRWAEEFCAVGGVTAHDFLRISGAVRQELLRYQPQTVVLD